MKTISVFIRVFPWLILPCLSVAIAASEKPRFESKLRDAAITVDGRYDDWYGNLQPFEQAPLALQFLNDGEYLYMRMTVSAAADRMQVTRQGFTVWFDPAGGTKKHFGVRYPVVEHGTGGGEEPRGGGGTGGYGGGRGRSGGGGREREAEHESPEPSPGDRIDVLGPGKDDARMLTRDHAQGVDAAFRMEQGTLQYELKVPLAKSADHPYAIGAVAGKPIGVGLEAGKSEQHSFGIGAPGGFGGGGGMGGRGGGMGGRGGGGSGRSGGGNRQGSPDSAKTIKGWGIVTIAPSPAR
jgi:hypothetical protein